MSFFFIYDDGIGGTVDGAAQTHEEAGVRHAPCPALPPLPYPGVPVCPCARASSALSGLRVL